MAKTKTTKSKTSSKEAKKMATPKESPEQLYAAAHSHLEHSEPEEALRKAQTLWTQVQDRGVSEALPALNLLGEICVELGDVDSARNYFENAVALDPTGQVPETMGGGAEKFLWLAQLCEEGGQQSVAWFERGAKALQGEITALESGAVKGLDEESLLMLRVEKKRKLANALCGIVEVYMTDLSWEEDAEARCESFITEAMAVEEETSPEVLQTLASVRLSQERREDARAALKRSMECWVALEPEDAGVPDFATRISLGRLLMEAEMEGEAMGVMERLVQEDDQSVEAWYLGGWCQWLVAGKAQADYQPADGEDSPSQAEYVASAHKGSRHWLKTSIKLYEMLVYEDDRLYAHARELIAELDGILGPADENADEEDEEEAWDGIQSSGEDDGDDDAEMKDA